MCSNVENKILDKLFFPSFGFFKSYFEHEIWITGSQIFFPFFFGPRKTVKFVLAHLFLLSLSLSLSLTHTHTHTITSNHTHIHTLSFSLVLKISCLAHTCVRHNMWDVLRNNENLFSVIRTKKSASVSQSAMTNLTSRPIKWRERASTRARATLSRARLLLLPLRPFLFLHLVTKIWYETARSNLQITFL